MKKLYAAIFLVSSSALIFEVSLTRLFSIYLSYHFAFLVISIAMLGIGSAGTLIFLKIKKNSINVKEFESGIADYAMLTGISMVASYITLNYIPFEPVELLWNRAQILYIALYCFVLSIPFFFLGLLLATSFYLYGEDSGRIYGSDLVGAGTGSLAVILILNIYAPEISIFMASTLSLIGAVIISGKTRKLLISILIGVNILLISFHPDFITLNISPYKQLALALKYPGAEHLKTYYSSYSRVDTFKSPSARYAPGLSLNYMEELPEQIGLAIDGDNINAVTDAGDPSRLKFLGFLPSAVVYEIGRRETVLVIDPKGGLPVMMARYYNSTDIHKFESNPLLSKVIRDDINEFSGKIFEKNVQTGYARNHLKADYWEGTFDIIDIQMTGASITGIYGISEDYRYTADAFEIYLNALKEDGILSITMYLLPPPRTEFRLLATIVSALKEIGTEDIEKNITAIRSWDSMTILAKKAPFTAEETDDLIEFSKERSFDLVYYPGIKESESGVFIKTASNDYFNGFQMILAPDTRGAFLNDYIFDIRPVSDENPFFNYYLKFRNIRKIYNMMGQRLLYFIEGGYLLPVILLIALVLSSVMILLPATIKHKRPESRYQKKIALHALLYFAMLGLGFMFIEVTLIHMSILVFENPTYTIAVVLTAILISAGTGSLFSSGLTKRRLSSAFIILIVLIVLYSILYPLLISLTSHYPIWLKTVIFFTAIFPAGFIMGIPFPSGIRILSELDPALIPWAWAINGCLSVIAPIITIMLAVLAGFSFVLWAGALTYLIAFISLHRLHNLCKDGPA